MLIRYCSVFFMETRLTGVNEVCRLTWEELGRLVYRWLVSSHSEGLLAFHLKARGSQRQGQC